MTTIFENDICCYISHKKLINEVYSDINEKTYQLNPKLFNIYAPYKTAITKSKKNRKREQQNDFDDLKKEQDAVKQKYTNFILQKCIKEWSDEELLVHTNVNTSALETADYIQTECEKHRNSVADINGKNDGPPVIKELNGSKFFFPGYSEFYAKDVFEMDKYLKGKKYDLILLDPPWWNKYIRRKRKKSSGGYNMMFNEDLKNLPIGSLLADDGLVVVWCTNSRQNFNALLHEVFPQWNVEFTAKWYWLKITTKGEPVCNFTEPPGKQPYEKVIFAHRKRCLPLPEDGKLLVSVPSALHSHKPPLLEVLKAYLPKNPRCLEVFARYLLPHWTSYGNEVLKLQHESLFILK